MTGLILGTFLGIFLGWYIRTAYQRFLYKTIRRLRRQMFGNPRRR